METDWMGLAGLLLMNYTDKEREIREQEKKIKQLEEEINSMKESQENNSESKDGLNFEGFFEDIMIKERKEMILKTVSNFKTQKPDLTKFDNLLKNYRHYRFGNLAKMSKLTSKVEDYKKFLAENNLSFDNRPFEIEEIKQQIINNKTIQTSTEADIENWETILKQKDNLRWKAFDKLAKAQKSIFKNLTPNRIDILTNNYNNCLGDYKRTESWLDHLTSKKNSLIKENEYLENKLQNINFMINAGTYNQLINVVNDYKKIESAMQKLVIEQEEKDKQGPNNWSTFLKENPKIFKDACDLHNYFKENNLTDRTIDDFTFDIKKYVNFGKFANCCSEFIDFDGKYKGFEKQPNNLENSSNNSMNL